MRPNYLYELWTHWLGALLIGSRGVVYLPALKSLKILFLRLLWELLKKHSSRIPEKLSGWWNRPISFLFSSFVSRSSAFSSSKNSTNCVKSITVNLFLQWKPSFYGHFSSGSRHQRMYARPGRHRMWCRWVLHWGDGILQNEQERWTRACFYARTQTHVPIRTPPR